MRRKVIQIADSTQLISLPRKWAQRYGVKKGDELEIEEQGNSVVIKTAGSEKLDATEVDISGLDRDSLMFLLRALYIRGYDEIKMVFSKPVTEHYRLKKKINVISAIYDEVNRLSGIEVVQQKQSYCIIKDISGSSMKEFDVVLKRIFLIIADASEDMINGTKEKNYTLLESNQEKHDTITKFVAFNLRLLNKWGYPEHKKTTALYHILFSLDSMIDIIKEISREIIDYKIVPSKSTYSFMLMTHEMVKVCCGLFYKFDL